MNSFTLPPAVPFVGPEGVLSPLQEMSTHLRTSLCENAGWSSRQLLYFPSLTSYPCVLHEVWSCLFPGRYLIHTTVLFVCIHDVRTLECLECLITSTHCYTSQSTSTHCYTSQSTSTHCYTSQSTSTHCYTSQSTSTHCYTSQSTSTHYYTSQSTISSSH